MLGNSARSRSLLLVRVCLYYWSICSLNAPSDASAIVKILPDFPGSAFELFVSGRLPTASQYGVVVRRLEDLASSTVLFDIIFAESELDVASLDKCLIPGGSILIAGDGASKNTHLLKSRSYTPLYTSLTLIDYQKTTSLSTPSTSSPFTPETDLVYTYALGREMELRQQLLALVPTKELTIWIVSEAGVNSAAGTGMVRALRREYLYWCLRFVELPAGKVSAAQMEEIREMLEGLPSWVKEEPDLVLDGQGAISVPRLVPIPDPSEQLESTILVEQASVSIDRVVRVSKMSPIVAAFASCANGTRLIGLQIADTGNAVLDLDLDSMVEVPEGVIFGPDDIDSVAGLVTALLALPALASLRRLPTAKLRAPSVLVTHADTPIGSVVRQLLEREGVSVTATSESVSLLDLATGKGKFDLLVSGYEEDSAHAQVLRATRRFFWEIELPRYLSQMPTRISDVLAAVFSKRYQDIHVPGALLPVSILGAPPDKLVGGKKGGAVFSAEKTYVLLGGLGNIGAHMALYLFQVRRLPNPLYFTDLVPQARSAPHHCYLPLRRKDACSPRRGHCSQDLRVPPLATKPLHPHRSDRRIVPSRDVGAICLDSQGAPSRRSYRSCSRSAR